MNVKERIIKSVTLIFHTPKSFVHVHSMLATASDGAKFEKMLVLE
jgi:hypothetical protein